MVDTGVEWQTRSGRTAELSVGIVVPCRDNSTPLYGVLRALAQQTVRPNEIVIVDDNSAPRQSAQIRELCADYSARYLRLPAPRNSLEAEGRRALARTLGTIVVDADIVLYIDGDMLLAPTYVQTVREQFKADNDIYLRGLRIGLPPDVYPRGIDQCLRGLARDWLPLEEAAVTYASRPPHADRAEIRPGVFKDRWYWCASNNLAVMKRHAVAAGLWDCAFVGWGEEDMDFSYRLHKFGLRPMAVETSDMRAYHLDHPIDWEANLTSLRRNSAYMVRKHPQTRQTRSLAYHGYGIDAGSEGG